MIRPHSPTENPAEKPAHSGDGKVGGVYLSPWELDQEWQDAPPARKKKRRTREEKQAEAEAEQEPPAPPPPPQPAPAPPPQKVRQVKTELRPDELPTARAQPAPQAQPQHKHSAAEFKTSRTMTPLPPKEKVRQALKDEIEREASWGTLIILSMALLGFVFIAWVFVQDQDPGFDEDLLFRPLPDQTTVIRTPEKIRRFLGSLVPPEDVPRGMPPWQWSTPILSKIVQANGAALDNLRDLLEDADWHPGHASWNAEDLGSDPRWNQALVLKQVEAAYLSRRMQEEQAFTAAVDLAEIGWRLEQIQAWPSFYVRSLEAHARAAQTLADLLRQTKLPETTLSQFQRQFTATQPGTTVLGNAMNAFYVHEKKLILGAQSGENLDTMPGGAQLRRPGRLFFKPNETVALFATALRQLKDEAKAPLAQTSEVRLKNAPTSESSLQPNAEGQAYFMRRMKTYAAMPAMLGLARARGNMVITLFAIRRCIAERKTIPTSLEQLRGFGYLSDIPLDPYTGAPIQYSAPRGLLWSVGNDLKSANGVLTEPPMNDPAEPTAQVGIGVAAAVR